MSVKIVTACCWWKWWLINSALPLACFVRDIDLPCLQQCVFILAITQSGHQLHAPSISVDGGSWWTKHSFHHITVALFISSKMKATIKTLPLTWDKWAHRGWMCEYLLCGQVEWWQRRVSADHTGWCVDGTRWWKIVDILHCQVFLFSFGLCIINIIHHNLMWNYFSHILVPADGHPALCNWSPTDFTVHTTFTNTLSTC